MERLLDFGPHFHFPVRDAVVHHLWRRYELANPALGIAVVAVAVHFLAAELEVFRRGHVDVDTMLFAGTYQIYKVIQIPPEHAIAVFHR
ncbi:hypothetical protein D3C84_1203020 [compost metagenome]